MTVAYFTSGLLIGVAVVGQLNDTTSSWGVLLFPAVVILAFAIALQYTKH